jgi:flagellar M-ring protein FliF
MVEASKVPEARLKLAAQGLPKGGSVGCELMDNQKFGTSQFAEQINYQRALEGELARSINGISAVESARVHLALPKASLFVRDQKKPSASVVLTLHPGRSIDEGQISAVVHLVSSSVPELSAKAITVVDQAGNLLSAANAGLRGLDLSQLKFTQEIEQSYARRIEAILQPILGQANVRAQVSADIDFSTIEKTDETYRPNQDPGQSAIRSLQSAESGQQAGAAAGGVPGALSNQPPIPATAPITVDPNAPAAPKPATAALTNGRRDTTTNFEVDRSIKHVQQGAGAIRRLSVAVVVNHRGSVNDKGERSLQALTPAELEQVNSLVREAMGFNRERGDSLNVVNSAFAGDAPPAIEPELPLWKQKDMQTLAMQAGRYLLLGMLGLFLWFSLLRPLLRKHLQPGPATLPLAGPGVTPLAEAAPAQTLPSPELENRDLQRHQDNVSYAQGLAVNDPRMVAMLVKSWMDKK